MNLCDFLCALADALGIGLAAAVVLTATIIFAEWALRYV